MQQLSFFQDQNIDILFKEMEIMKEKMNNLRKNSFVKIEILTDVVESLQDEIALLKGEDSREGESNKIVNFKMSAE